MRVTPAILQAARMLTDTGQIPTHTAAARTPKRASVTSKCQGKQRDRQYDLFSVESRPTSRQLLLEGLLGDSTALTV